MLHSNSIDMSTDCNYLRSSTKDKHQIFSLELLGNNDVNSTYINGPTKLFTVKISRGREPGGRGGNHPSTL